MEGSCRYSDRVFVSSGATQNPLFPKRNDGRIREQQHLEAANFKEKKTKTPSSLRLQGGEGRNCYRACGPSQEKAGGAVLCPSGLRPAQLGLMEAANHKEYGGRKARVGERTAGG